MLNMVSFAVNSVIQFRTKARLLNFSLNSIYLFACLFIYLYLQWCVCMPQCMYGNEKTAKGSVLSFHQVTVIRVKAFIDMYG